VGSGVLSDDIVRDVYDDYIDLFNRGNLPEVSRQKILQKHADVVADADEGPLIWIGIAKAQWDCGQLEPTVFSKVRQIVDEGLGLARWAEQGDRLLLKRKAALNQFLSKLETSTPALVSPEKL
jgi:hypothetical protein